MRLPPSLLEEINQDGKKKIKEKKMTRKEKRKLEKHLIKRKNHFTPVENKIEKTAMHQKVKIVEKEKTMTEKNNQKSKEKPKTKENEPTDTKRSLKLSQDKEDDAMVNHYAKKLKIKDSKKIGQAFVEDGLDDLLQFCHEFDERKSEFGLEKIDEESEDNQESEGSEEQGDEFGDEIDEEEICQENEELEDGHDGMSDEEIDESEDVNDEVSESEEELEHESEKDEIQNFKINEKPAAYIPPALRQTNDKELLGKKIKGLLNKLSDSNIEPIFSQIEQLFYSNPRNDVSSILSELVLESICGPSYLLDSFVLSHTVVYGLVYHIIGADVGASFVQQVIEKLCNEWKVVENESKSAMNLLTLICFLYSFKAISHTLVMDLVLMFVDRMYEFDMELILKVLKLNGFLLRSHEPLELKKLIENIIKKSNEMKEKSARFRFMLESVEDVKNNKKKRIFDDEPVQKMLKLIRNSVNQRSIGLREALNISLDDIRKSDKQGKWWLVGAAWKGKEDSNTPTVLLPANAEMLTLARQQGMNTDVRKNIFVVLMTSEDFADCFERLLKLNLKDKQEREIIRVLMHCCGQETTFNPYYSFLAQKLCQFSFNFKITLQYCYWDFFKTVDESISLRKVRNLAKLLTFLVGHGTLSLSIFKTVAYEKCKNSSLIFHQLFLSEWLTSYPEQDIIKSVQRILPIRELMELRDGLLYFLVKRTNPLLVPVSDMNLFKQRKKQIKRLLESAEMTLFDE